MAKKERMTVDRVHGAWAIIPTPAKAGASDWRMQSTVDLDETARMVDALIASGADAIMGLGSLGEAATLTWDEKKAFVSTVVDAARGRVPLFFGTTSFNTRDTIEQTRTFYDMGVDGIMLGAPMWCAPDTPTAVQFFRDVTEGCPETAVCVYANTEAFKYSFPPPFWAQVSELPQVITAKYLSIALLLTDLHFSQRKIRLLPIDMDYYAAARIDPEFMTAFWSSGMVCGPSVYTELRDEVIRAKQTGDWNAARRITGELSHAGSTMFPNGSFKEFSTYNIGLEKHRMDVAGWMKAGPPRPPYHLVPQPYLDGAALVGERIAALHRKYARAPQTADIG
jgi:trans-o-hydroxybenzylidenepyruvate hydratase-aldolase